MLGNPGGAGGGSGLYDSWLDDVILEQPNRGLRPRETIYIRKPFISTDIC